jgi:hypothetical protein
LKKSGLIIPLLLFCLFSCWDQKKETVDCSAIKTGKFEYRSDLNKDRISVERNDSIQVEKNRSMEFRLRVKWIDSCTYELSPISFKMEGKKQPLEGASALVIVSEIIKVTPNYYIAESRTKGKNDPSIDTILVSK